MLPQLKELLVPLQKIKLWHILTLVGVLLMLGVFVFFAQTFTLSKPVITLTDTGFVPAELSITEGQTVVFKSNAGEAFWPASNVHPTHTTYPDFDPKKPIAPNQTWEYTFTEAGTYKFHDHIKSIYEGVITVVKKDGTQVTVDCSENQNQQCWENLILQTLTVEGVKAAFEKIVYLGETEPGFANDCHGLGHLVGEKAYEQYVNKEKFEITPATALCGYGFYHGFMETLLLTTGNIDEAREFCMMIDEQLREQAASAGAACYHGSGHGTIDGSDPTVWGDVDAMMAPGFALCAKLAKNELEAYLCDTGVFNAIEILSADPKYGLSDLQTHPFAMCNTQTVARREGCYANMVPILLNLYDNDIQKVMDYVNKHMIDHEVIAIDGNTVNDLTTIGIMFEYIRLYGETQGYQEEGIAFCRAQEEDDRLACIAGLSGGHIKYGEPGKEYVKNLEFCAHPMLAEDERDSCYQYTLPRMSGRYTPKDTQMICSLVPELYREKYCPY